MACGVFRGCTSLSELAFDRPSRLKQLDLPPSEFGSLCIPDSVEIVFVGVGSRADQRRLLQFGRESCLMKIEWRHEASFLFLDGDGDATTDLFLDLSESVLKRFRCQFEAL
jgi:hypothetical protein